MRWNGLAMRVTWSRVDGNSSSAASLSAVRKKESDVRDLGQMIGSSFVIFLFRFFDFKERAKLGWGKWRSRIDNFDLLFQRYTKTINDHHCDNCPIPHLTESTISEFPSKKRIKDRQELFIPCHSTVCLF